MSDSESQSPQNYGSKNQHPQDLIRDNYNVRASGGQQVIRPNAFEGIELPLVEMHRPDFTKAVNMPIGVSIIFIWNFSYGSIYHIFCLSPHLSSNHRINPDRPFDIAGDNQKTV